MVTLCLLCVFEMLQGYSKNLRQPGNESFQSGINKELCHRSCANFMFLPLSPGIELPHEPGNLPTT